MNEPDRAEFEKWFTKRNKLPNNADLTQYDRAFEPFKAWQAALEWERSKSIPEGWQLVPKEPTMDMVVAGDDTGRKITIWHGGADVVPAIYVAMLAAAPKPEEAP